MNMSDEMMGHLVRWCANTYGDDVHGFDAFERIYAMVREYPEMLNTRSWPEIDAMSSR